MSANNIVLTLQALLFQPSVQSIKAVEPRGWDKEVPPTVTNDAFDIPVRSLGSNQWRLNGSLVTSTRTAKPVLKQVVRL